MSVNKINDADLYSEKRFNVSQDDVPGKSAQQMKEFMDYIPRQVLIPKINEVIDEFDTKANTDEVYAKTQADSLLLLKADDESVYKKSETYNKSEVDSFVAAKAGRTDVYTKAETDTMLADKACNANVYTRTETDSLLDGKISVSEGNVIKQVENVSEISTPGVYNVSGEHYIKNNLSRLSVGQVITNLYFNATLSELRAWSEQHGSIAFASLTLDVEGYGNFIATLNAESSGSDYETMNFYISGNYGFLSYVDSSALTLNIKAMLESEGYNPGNNFTITSLTDTEHWFNTSGAPSSFSKIASQEYVDDAVAAGSGEFKLPTFDGAYGFYDGESINLCDGVTISGNSLATFLSANNTAPMIYITNFNSEGYNESSETQNILFTNCGGYAFQSIQSINRDAFEIFTFTSTDNANWTFNIKACAYIS